MWPPRDQRSNILILFVADKLDHSIWVFILFYQSTDLFPSIIRSLNKKPKLKGHFRHSSFWDRDTSVKKSKNEFIIVIMDSGIVIKTFTWLGETISFRILNECIVSVNDDWRTTRSPQSRCHCHNTGGRAHCITYLPCGAWTLYVWCVGA